MTYHILETARENMCPIARCFGGEIKSECRGDDCMLWRWKPIMAGHPLWVKAVKSEAEKLGEKAPFPKAARIVADDPEAFGLMPTEGWCGLGGQPK